MVAFRRVGVWGLIVAAAFSAGWWGGYADAEQAAKAKVYEMRTYHTLPGRLPNLHARFRDHTMKLFAKHGMENVIYTTPQGVDNQLVYLLAHDSREAAKASFDAFRQDPEWIAARDASEKDGKIVDKIESVFLVPTDYSPMK
jgi:hypothetical protein